MASDPPKVLISYSHDSPEHQKRVLTLANRLRVDGVDCLIDQYVVVPASGWPLWMERQIEVSEFVLIVCTETYYRRVRDDEESGKGLGVRWEGRLIYRALYEDGRSNTKFIPVLFETGDSVYIPGPVGGTNSYLVQTERGYEDLYRRLTNQPLTIKPELGRLRSLPPAERKSEGAVALESVLSNLPERNPYFTGWEDVLIQLQEALATQGRAALSGLGGVGKTQTAVEYANRHLNEYDYIFWTIAHSREALVSSYLTAAGLLNLPESNAKEQVTADSREALLSSHVTVAGLLNLSESSAKEQPPAVDAVKRWLGSHGRWLLILDNVDEIQMARDFTPLGKNGHVLLTTRARAVGAVARLVEIREMGTEEGALFLLRRSRCIADDEPLEAAKATDRARSKEIVAQLDGLPLALDQAASYVEETGCGLSGYLDLYRSRALDLLGLRGTLGTGHPDPVATTWALSFEKIEQAKPFAAELLRFCAFLHPDRIPEEVFSEGSPDLGPVLGPVGSDAFKLNGAIAEILKYSLLRRDSNARILVIHRLVQAVLKQGMDETTQRLWAERAVKAVSRAFPSVEFSNSAICERLLPQARACAELINQWGFEFREAARLLRRAGVYLYEHGHYTDAEPLYKRTLAIREKVMGPEHPDVARSLNNLGWLYGTQGQYAKAEPLYLRALEIFEKALGPEHPEVATSLNALAVLYDAQDQYAKAEPLYERALAIREKALGPEHPRVAGSLNNLAVLYRARGQYAKAQPLYQRALAINEKVLGSEHPDVATSLRGLGRLYRTQRQYAKAEPLFQRALAIWEKALGTEHPDVATSLSDLGWLYRTQGQYAKAEPLYQRAVAIWEKALGEEHPDVAKNLNNLALLYCNQGQYAKAEPLYRRALAIWGKAMGPEHPNVATCLENYAVLLRNMGRPEEAAPLESRARVIRAKKA